MTAAQTVPSELIRDSNGNIETGSEKRAFLSHRVGAAWADLLR